MLSERGVVASCPNKLGPGWANGEILGLKTGTLSLVLNLSTEWF